MDYKHFLIVLMELNMFVRYIYNNIKKFNLKTDFMNLFEKKYI